jgi:hypothetical protein
VQKLDPAAKKETVGTRITAEDIAKLRKIAWRERKTLSRVVADIVHTALTEGK